MVGSAVLEGGRIEGMLGGVRGRLGRVAGGVVLTGGGVPALACFCVALVAAWRAAFLSAPSALRLAAAASHRALCSALRCSLSLSCFLVGRGWDPLLGGCLFLC